MNDMRPPRKKQKKLELLPEAAFLYKLPIIHTIVVYHYSKPDFIVQRIIT